MSQKHKQKSNPPVKTRGTRNTTLKKLLKQHIKRVFRPPHTPRGR